MDIKFIVAGVAVASLAVGGAGGYLAAKKKLVKEYDDRLEGELAAMKRHFAATAKKEYESPAEAAEELLGEAVTAMVDYGARTVSNDEEVAEDGTRVIKDAQLLEVSLQTDPNPFTEAAGVESVVTKRNVFADEPDTVLIDFEGYAHAEGYDQEILTYFMGDKVLMDQQEHVIEHEYVGEDNLRAFHTDDNTTEIYVQNNKISTVYEITRSTGKYANEVAGLQHSDVYERTPRKKRLRDD